MNVMPCFAPSCDDEVQSLSPTFLHGNSGLSVSCLQSLASSDGKKERLKECRVSMVMNSEEINS